MHPTDVDESRHTTAPIRGPLSTLSGILQLLAGEPEWLDPITELVTYERGLLTAVPPRAFVLGVGLSGDEARSALELLAGRRAAALAIRAPEPVDGSLLATAYRAGVTLLRVADDVSWDQLGALIRSVVSEHEQLDAIGGIVSGDLDAVAEAIAALVDAPITIEGVDGQVLAFSAHGTDVDEIRTGTILDRRTDPEYLAADRSRGVFASIQRSHGPVFVAPLERPGQPTTLPRVAMAARVGDETLGYIWAVVREPLSPERERALADAAPLTALHIIRQRVRIDLRRQLMEDLVSDVLRGTPSAVHVAHRLGLQDQRTIVIAASAAPVEGGRGIPDAERARLQDDLAQDLAMAFPRSVATQEGGILYGIIPMTAGDAASRRLVGWCSDFASRRSGRTRWRIAVGRAVREITDLPRSREDADRVLRVLRAEDGRVVATLSDVYSRSLLMDLAEMIRDRGDDLSDELTALLEYDAAHSTDLVRTLEAWLDAHGVVPVASKAVNVHPNTFRYRMQRIGEISGLDPDDPDARFSAWLQLRLLNAGMVRPVPPAGQG